MVCYIFNCTFVDRHSSCATMFSSLASFCIIYASTKYWSLTSSSSDSSVHTGSTNVTPGHVCSLAHQRHLLLLKNSIANVPIIFMSWIIVYINCIFSIYTFPSTHFEDDDECDNDLTTNAWIFNTPLSSLFNYSSILVLLKKITSSSYHRLWSLFYISFSLEICYSFSITLSVVILLWTPKLWKCTQLLETNANWFQ
jgi:hypothetical protein